MKKSRKGVSPIIAVLLMIVIAVAAAIVVYSFVMGFIGSSASAPMETQARIVVDEANITKGYWTGWHVIVFVRNVGEIPVHVTQIYLLDINGTLVHASQPSEGASVLIDVDSVKRLHSVNVTTYYPSTLRHYMVKVVTAEGAVAVSMPIPFQG